MAEVIESAAFTDEDWEDLFYYIKNKNTTPFLGSGISRQHFGTGKDLADKIATEFGYPFNDDYDLAKVAQFATIRKKGDSFRVRTFVADYIKNKKLPDFHDPSEPHMILSKLNLPIYITTNYDHLMYEALKSDGKKPVIEFCRWNDLAQIQGKSSIFDQFNEFDPYNPVVYHIHGEIDNPQSMVLTQDDYLNFIVKLYVDIDKLFPAQIRLRFASSSIMFIGYSLSDWNLRIILRQMAYSMKSTSTTHCSIQLIPTDVKPGYENKIKDDLKSYFQIIQGVNLNVFWGSAIDFCHTLSEKAKIKM